jgi:anaerobic selenocysteine-containing dehydrogenase
MADTSTSGTRIVPTFCRICEPLCGLVAEVDGETVVDLRPDRDHPVSNGFACHKGTSFHQVHHSPDRLDHPLRRTNTKTASIGEFERVSWDEAIADIGERLFAIREEHGPEAVGCYWGNPLAYTAAGIPTVYGFWEKMGSTRLFGGLTQDLSNKFAAMDAMFGVEARFPAPDLFHTDYLLLLGSDPTGGHMTAVSVPNVVDALRGIRDRGGHVTFVNPRRVQAVDLGLGDLLQLRPDTDAYLLAALLTEIDRLGPGGAGGWCEEVLAAHGRNVDGLRAFVQPYDADAVAPVTGLPADDIRRVARDFAAAPSAVAHMGTGGNMGRQGTIVYWLLTMLNLATGNLGRAGGGLLQGQPPTERFDELPERFFDSPVGPVRHTWGHLPATLMPEFIEADRDPVRAMVVIGGNPIMAVPGEERLRETFPQLELLVTIDLFRSATAELSDYVLPASDWLERDDLRRGGMALVPSAQYSEAVVTPIAERREEWWILARIEQALGLPNAIDQGFDFGRVVLEGTAQHMGTSVDELRAEPRGLKLLGEPQNMTVEESVAFTDGRIDCCPPTFGPLLARAHEIFGELQARPDEQLQLVQWRNRRQHNSWGRRIVPTLRRGEHARNPLLLCATDAERLGLAPGDEVVVRSDAGEVRTVAGLDDALRPGVVALSHGYGERSADDPDDLEVGVNVNRLLPTGPGSYEHYSGMAFMQGVPVTVEPVH